MDSNSESTLDTDSNQDYLEDNIVDSPEISGNEVTTVPEEDDRNIGQTDIKLKPIATEEDK
jgi:hypothetical protein